MGRFSVQLFGAFALRRNGELLPNTRTRKEQWVLALLILRHPVGIERSWLAGAMWPDFLEFQARENLRHSLSNLRIVLGPDSHRLISDTSRSLRFDVSGVDIDVLAFDAAIASGENAALREAMATYRGMLLEGCDEEWLLPERHVREQAYMSTLEMLAGHARVQSDYAGESGFLRLILAADPYRESAVCALMEVLVAKGDPSAASRAYRDYRLMLHQEMNAQPRPETTALYEKLVKPTDITDPHSQSRTVRVSNRSASGSIPNPLSQLIGRERNIEEVCECLKSSRLVTLRGPGGGGKTRLAIAIGRRLWEEYSGQIWFVSLAEQHAPEQLPETLRDALHLQQDQGRPP